MKKNIYLTATPIGNNNDISLEAINLFNSTDLIICEDTRKIMFLLKYHKIPNIPKMFVVNKFNENKISTFSQLQKKLEDSQNIMWVSDAGYPLFCDPGFKIKKQLEDHYDFKIISGPSSFIHALILSGMPLYPFYFAGFLNNKNIAQKNQLKKIKNNINGTIVLFESVHRIIKLLENINDVYGDIQVCVCREISKTYETVYKDNVSKLLLENNIITKGEFVVIFQNLQ